jgi:hypothetical protein
MRALFRSAPGLLVLGVALLGCHQSNSNGGNPPASAYTDTEANQVVIWVPGIS